MNNEVKIFEFVKKPNKHCTVNDLTDEEKRIWCFMDNSERTNGIIVVPPWMKEKAEAVLKKLGISF